jgi:hypothetical protein
VKGRKLSCYPAVSPEIGAAGGEYVALDWPEAMTDRNLVTGPAWTCHVEWIRQCLHVLGTRSTHEEAVAAARCASARATRRRLSRYVNTCRRKVSPFAGMRVCGAALPPRSSYLKIGFGLALAQALASGEAAHVIAFSIS